ncbi:MAG: O-antigen ligase family protein [Dehalococcoidia bacterium]
MTAATSYHRGSPVLVKATGRGALLAGWMGLLLVAAASAALLGPWALMLPVYVFGIFSAIVNPRATAAGLLIIGISLEPAAIDFTGPIANAFWQMPPGFENAFKITTSPIEVVLYITTISALVTIPSRTRLPLIAWAVPLVMVMGFAYGAFKGGEINLGYNEGRGLIAGTAMFVLAVRVLPSNLNSLVKPLIIGESILAVTIILRYIVFIRGNRLTVPVEFAFSHEGSVILGVGFVVGMLAIIRENATISQRMKAAAYSVLILAAMIASGRRAATLVLLVGGLSIGALLFPRRPMLVILTAIPLALAGSVYLAAYWNQEYGAIAQPARAIRSQFDPTIRDESSDDYRTIEKYDVIQTIRVNRLFGVGFGQPFYEFQPLPNLGSFWSLQKYTPHQNILWLWLKMGILGIAVVLGFAAAALGRCRTAMRDAASNEEWLAAAVGFTVIVMFLMYSTVDLGFIGPRSLAPAAIAAALAFTLKSGARTTE